MEAAFGGAFGLGAEAGGGLFAFFAAFARLFSFGDAEIYGLVAVFTRVGAAAALAPGFGEQAIPARVKLAVAVAFTLIVWPSIAPVAVDAPATVAAAERPAALWRLILAEAAAGLCLGLSVRLLVFALQYAGSIAAQSTAVAQILGGGVTPDPMPAVGGVLTLAGVTLAMSAGLHVKLATAMIGSYSVLPFGVFPVAGDLAAWGVARGAQAFALAFGLAAPFVVAALLYNLALGAINRAMPQLMVAFIGAPAITGGALILLFVAGPVALIHWAGLVDEVLAAPFSLTGPAPAGGR